MLQYDWEFNVLGVYNYKKPGHLSHFFDYVLEHHDHVPGDVLEAGVFRGSSLLAMAMLLKELGSTKKVYGFDTFSGFPPVYHDNDDISKFDALRDAGEITEEHLRQVKTNLSYRSMLIGQSANVETLSSSGDFSNANYELLVKKIERLELDNIVLIKGPFEETMADSQAQPLTLMCSLLDCDLYSSYKTALPFIWQRTAVGGYVYLDEYYSLKFPGAKIACNEFFASVPEKPFKHKLVPGSFERWGVCKLHGE